MYFEFAVFTGNEKSPVHHRAVQIHLNIRLLL
jgi:hypothetical protein